MISCRAPSFAPSAVSLLPLFYGTPVMLTDPLLASNSSRTPGRRRITSDAMPTNPLLNRHAKHVPVPLIESGISRTKAPIAT